MDFNKVIADAIADRIKNKVPELIENSVDQMMKRIIEDIFSTWSPIAKQAKEQIEKKLDLNLQAVDLLDYNGLVISAISGYLKNEVEANSIDPIKKMVDGITGYQERAEITLSEINDKLTEMSMEYHDTDAEGGYTLHIGETSYGSKYICWDQSEDVDKWNCAVRIMVNEDGKIFSLMIKDYAVSHHDMSPAILSRLRGEERYFFRLYASNTLINIDDYDPVTDWDKYD